MNPLLTTIVWIATAACTLAGIRAYLGTRKLQRTTARLEGILCQAAEDRVFAHWARWTMLCVTDTHGEIHAATLHQLYTSGPWDQVWDTPIAVALWHGDPDMIDRYHTELDQEEDTRG